MNQRKGKVLNDISAVGELTITLRGPNGKIKERETYDNLVVFTGRRHIADQMTDRLEAPMSHMAIGTGTTAQTSDDTALQTEINRKAFQSKTQGSTLDANKVIYLAHWPQGEGDGAITEAGIFNSNSAGIMFSRTVFPVKNKGANDSLTLTWTITYNAAS